MNGKPAVSFLIPAHDRPRELKAALASCLAQSCGDWEAVVVDDHSEAADLEEVVAGFGEERLRYARLEGEGTAARELSHPLDHHRQHALEQPRLRNRDLREALQHASPGQQR